MTTFTCIQWIEEIYVNAIPLPIRIIFRVIALQGTISVIYSILFNWYIDPKKEQSNPPGIFTLVSSTLVTPFVFWRRKDQHKNQYKQIWVWDTNTLFMIHWMLLMTYILPKWLNIALIDLGLIDDEETNNHDIASMEHNTSRLSGHMHPLMVGIITIFLFEIIGRCQRKETLKNLEATLRWVWVIIPITMILALYLFIPTTWKNNDPFLVSAANKDNNSGIISNLLYRGFGLNSSSSSSSSSSNKNNHSTTTFFLNETAHNEGCGMAFYILLLMFRYVLDAFRNVCRIVFVFYGAPRLIPLLRRWNKWQMMSQRQQQTQTAQQELNEQDSNSSNNNNNIMDDSWRSNNSNGSSCSNIYYLNKKSDSLSTRTSRTKKSYNNNNNKSNNNESTNNKLLLPEWAKSHHSLLRESIQLIVGVSILPLVFIFCGIVSSCSSSYNNTASS